MLRTALRQHPIRDLIVNGSYKACQSTLLTGFASFMTTSAPPTALATLAPRAAVTLREVKSPSLNTVWNVWRSQGHWCSHNGSGNLPGVRWASGPTPPFVGGKLKPYSSFKQRFKLTGGGRIRYMRPGHVHKRHSKGRRQLQELSESKIMHPTYEKTMKRLGFVMRRF